MLYVMTGSIHDHLDKQERISAFSRRAEWHYPKGVDVKAEAWCATAPQIIVMFEADSYGPIQQMLIEWGDFMAMRVSPATTPEQGLIDAREALARMP